MIANDNLISALEIIELYCEQLHVRANILDHLAFGQKRKPPVKKRGSSQQRSVSSTGSKGNGGGGSNGWGLWKLLGLGGGSPAQSQQQQDQRMAGGDAAHASTGDKPASAEAGDEEPIKQPEHEVFIDPELDRAAAVIFYSYPRLPRDIPGLPELRMKLIHRWGNDFASRAQDDDNLPVDLPQELIDRLRVQKAPPILVEKYLKEIARGYGITWHLDEDEAQDEDEDGSGDQKVGEIGSLPEFFEGASAVVPSQQNAKQLSGNVPLPGTRSPDAKPEFNQSGSSPTEVRSGGVGAGIPDVDELAKRFAALKK